MIDHQWAMVCWALQELIEVGFGLFQSYERLDSRWRDGVRRNDPQYALEQGLELRDVLADLLAARKQVIHLIAAVEAKGYAIEGATQYRATSMLPFDDRPLDVPFAEADLRLLATAGKNVPENACPADDGR